MSDTSTELCSPQRAPLRIALVGRSGAGKSEVARLLSESAGCRIVKTGAICRQIARLLFGNEDKRSTQLLDDALTQIDPSIFLRAALRDIPMSDELVIDAVRFASDVELARERGCKIVRVIAAEQLRINRLQSRGQSFDPVRDGAHRSEVELDDLQCEFLVQNDGDLDHLQQAVRQEILARL